MHLQGKPSMVFLVLSPEEDPEVYKDALAEIGTQIFLNAEKSKYKKMVPKLYKQIERFTQMTAEQMQASVLNDPIRRVIVQTLMKNGTVQSDELEQMILDEIGKKIEVDLILRPLVKMGVVATGWVEGLASEVIYLTRALFILRKVSHETVQAVQSNGFSSTVAKQFLELSTKYHQEYLLQFKENLFDTLWSEAENLSKFFLDFDAYDIIHSLRAGPIELEELQKKFDLAESKFKKILKELKDADIITQIKDEDNCSHVMLLCNPELSTVYPEWLIQRIVELYNAEDVNSRQAMHYLEVLKMSHPSQIALMTEIDET
jgi:predicted transcriptional regulator